MGEPEGVGGGGKGCRARKSATLCRSRAQNYTCSKSAVPYSYSLYTVFHSVIFNSVETSIFTLCCGNHHMLHYMLKTKCNIFSLCCIMYSTRPHTMLRDKYSILRVCCGLLSHFMLRDKYSILRLCSLSSTLLHYKCKEYRERGTHSPLYT